MIKVISLINILKRNNTNFFTGVPDSVLKELSIHLKYKSKKHTFKKSINQTLLNFHFNKFT